MALLFFFGFHFFLFPLPCHASGAETTIVSQTLQYFSNMKKYVATGAVRIVQEDAVIEADEVTYHEETAEISASGRLKYRDSAAMISADKAELNMEKKTGRLFDADVFLEQGNQRLRGREIERIAEDEYASRGEVSFTTCNGPVADWCIRARDVALVTGRRITARDATFRVRDIPVLYTPYFHAPLTTERQTGFLMPTVSSSDSRGAGLNVPFFWAIAENRDATFVLDAYSKRGIGKGLEYRYLEPRGISGSWWLYHIRDTQLNTDFVEVKALHENRTGAAAAWFLNIDFVNEKDFYREFNPRREKQIQRFLESSGEFSMPFEKSRLYFLSQYRVDLRHDTGDAPQRLPEAGYVMNYARSGSFLISTDLSAANLWRENGVSAKRFDIYPRVLHTAGSDYVLTQVAAVRGTAYSFYGGDDQDNSVLRRAFEYDGSVHTRLYRKYATFMHVVEPTVRYHYIASSKNNLPVFDEYEFFKKKSRVEAILMNRIFVQGRETAAFYITQPFDTDRGSRAFAPLEAGVGMTTPLAMKAGAAYDTRNGRLMTVSSEIGVPFPSGLFTFGQRYDKEEDIMVYKAGIEAQPSKSVHVGLSVWYDAKGEGFTNVTARVRYESQCWGLGVETSKKPGDFMFMIKFDLFGVTAKPEKV